LDVLAPKHPDEIYKQYLETNRRLYNDNIDSAKKNLALTYVSAFVNAGYGKDKLILEEKKEENKDGDWVFKVKEDGQTAAAASLGLLMLWDCDEAFD
jgi:26S proteasome regulatory subunit N1